MPKKSIGFYICGLTGGPFLPIPAVIDMHPEVDPILIGVSNSFEQQVSIKLGIPLIILPKAKLNISSFSKNTFFEVIIGVLDAIINVTKLILSLVVSLFYVIKYRPSLVFGSGSFLSVPVVCAVSLTNLLRITKCQIWIHQMDPMPGLANRLIARLATKKTCAFNYTKQNYNLFANAEVIGNPLKESNYDTNQDWQNSNLLKFIKKSSKPKFLVFGGGSGSVIINKWVADNIEELKSKFDVIHLSGAINDKELTRRCEEGYFRIPSVIEDMPRLLASCDVVLCRAGVGSISELLFLNKYSFLVPIPNTHQELNAEIVKDQFVVLDQSNTIEWLRIIDSNLNKFKN